MKSVYYFAVVSPKTTKINIGMTALLPVFLSLQRAITCMVSLSHLAFEEKQKAFETKWFAAKKSPYLGKGCGGSSSTTVKEIPLLVIAISCLQSEPSLKNKRTEWKIMKDLIWCLVGDQRLIFDEQISQESNCYRISNPDK